MGSEQLTSGPTAAGSEAERIFKNLRSLRNQLVTAWRERAVMLDAEEREQLRKEIQETCQFLELLAGDD